MMSPLAHKIDCILLKKANLYQLAVEATNDPNFGLKAVNNMHPVAFGIKN